MKKLDSFDFIGKLAIATWFLFICCGHNHSYGNEALVKPSEKQIRLITISQGIEIVLQDSRLIKVALPDIDIAQQDSFVARSALLPHLNASAAQTFNRFQPAYKFDSLVADISDKNYLSYGIQVYQTLFDFGKSLSNYRAAKELMKANKAKVESVQRVAVLEFIMAYFNVLESEKMIIVAGKEVENLESYLNDIERLYEHGVAVQNDLLPAKVKLADVKQRLIAVRNDNEIAYARLNNILAFPLTEKIALQDISMSPPQFPEMAAAWKMAQTQRPEICFLEDQLAASASREWAREVENLPVFFAEGGYSYARNEYSLHQDNVSIVLGARMNLYDGGASRAELLKERFRQRQLSEQKDKLIEDIKLEVEDSYFSLKNACEKTLVAKDALGQAEENVRVYRVKYNAGSATPTEVLESITLQTRAHLNYYSSDYDMKRNHAKLMYSMGEELASLYQKADNSGE